MAWESTRERHGCRRSSYLRPRVSKGGEEESAEGGGSAEESQSTSTSEEILVGREEETPLSRSTEEVESQSASDGRPMTPGIRNGTKGKGKGCAATARVLRDDAPIGVDLHPKKLDNPPATS
mmetsp:Transcript_29546/g.87522  ORF Transcript_29546/g.87522 Transcript_29546/m.87522 type:complete len:122 (+) Transcript_29546:1092-1457(+)